MSFTGMIRECRKNKRMLIGGHRGHLSRTRENTLDNFEEVRRAGIPYIEIDVQLSKDSEPVIFHDRDLSERTPLSGRTRDYTVEEMKQAFELCTLSEAIQWCHDKKMKVLLEIKSREIDGRTDRLLLAVKIIEVLRRDHFFDECIVFSIDHRILRMIKDIRPKTEIALIVPHVPHDPAGLMRDLDAVMYLSFLDGLSVPLVEELHSAGYIVDGSVVNTAEELRLAMKLGVDMIESDHPEKITAIYESEMGTERMK